MTVVVGVVVPGGSYLFCFWTLGNTNKNLHKIHASNNFRLIQVPKVPPDVSTVLLDVELLGPVYITVLHTEMYSSLIF